MFSRSLTVLDINTGNCLVIDKPFPADKKFYPKKSLIVVISTLCAFILTLIVLLIIERIENQSVRKDPAADPQDQ